LYASDLGELTIARTFSDWCIFIVHSIQGVRTCWGCFVYIRVFILPPAGQTQYPFSSSTG